MVDISISIVNFNACSALRDCLVSVRKNIKDITFEVIVADNNSADGSIQMLAGEFPYVKIISNKENLGVSKAKNLTFAQAAGRYILVLDSDIEILPGSVKKMFDFMQDNYEAGIVGPAILFGDGSPQHSCNKGFPNLFKCFLNKIFFYDNIRYRFYKSRPGAAYIKKRYNRCEEFSWIGGMCLLVRREVIDKLNGYDGNIFLYYDDTDFCFRAKKNNFKIFYLPQAQVIHHMSKSVKNFNNFVFEKIFESEFYFFKKHYGIPQAKVCAFLTQLSMILRMVLISPLYITGIRKDVFGEKMRAYCRVLSLAKRQIHEQAD